MFSLVGGPSVSFVSFLAPGLACLCLCLLSKVLLCSPSSACLVSLCRSVPPSLPLSLPSLPLLGGRGPGEPGLSLVPLSRPPSPRRRRLRGMSPPPPPWNRMCVCVGGGGSASPSGQPPEEIVPSSSPFLCGRGRVASCGSEAEEALGRARAFGRPARWRPRWPATATRPRDGRAVCQEPPGGRFYIVPPLWSFGETFRRIMTQPPGPRQSCQGPATLAVTVPGTPRPRDVLLSPEIGSLGFWGG